MINLDIIADQSKVKFEKKIKDEKTKIKKLKELIEYDEYERAMRFAAEKTKQ